MKDYIKLIRPVNILIMALVVCLMQFCVIQPVISHCHVPLISGELVQQLSIDHFPIVFGLLLLSVITIGAAGYVINDYFDTKIDEINKPEKVIIGKTITRRQAGIYFQTLLIIGNIAGVALAIMLRNLTLVFIYAGISGILWFYSSSYKRQLLIGNIMIAFCTFLCVFLVGYVSVKATTLKYGEIIYHTEVIPFIYFRILGFSTFAFLLTLIREMTKDIEDIEGDREMECRTMPIVWGVKASKIIITILASIIMGLLIAFGVYFGTIMHGVHRINTTYSFAVGLVMMLIIFLVMLWDSKCKNGYHKASNILKLTMVVGMCYSIVLP